MTCVPIKDLKDTAAFAKTVESSDEPIMVTRNGREAFCVVKPELLDSLRLEAARAKLYDLVDEGEADIAAGRLDDALGSNAAARKRFGLA